MLLLLQYTERHLQTPSFLESLPLLGFLNENIMLCWQAWSVDILRGESSMH